MQTGISPKSKQNTILTAEVEWKKANRKVKGTLHWVSVDHCSKAEVRVYDRLFNVENLQQTKGFP